MAKKFAHLRAKMSPERQRQNRAEANRTLLELNLQELRQNVTNLSQEDIAEILRVTQGYVSKLERQDDMLLSRLYAYVKALGGELEIRATFPDEEIKINQYREVEKLRLHWLRDSSGARRHRRTTRGASPVRCLARMGLGQSSCAEGGAKASTRPS